MFDGLRGKFPAPLRTVSIRGLRTAALLLAILIVLGISARQTRLLDKLFIFFPERELIGTPADEGLEYEDVFFSASDGVQIHGWFVPGESDTTLLWFHGNAGNVSHRVDNISLLHERLGINIFIFDYRGYGRSEGTVSEKGMYMDAEAAMDHLRSRNADEKLVLFGRSLGAGVAVEMATRHPVYAIILESPFTSIEAIAKHTNPVLSAVVPVGAVLRSKYDSLAKIKDVRSPLMVLHGDRDEIAPFELGRELFEAANEPRRFYTIAGAGHNDTYLVGGEAYFEALESFIVDPDG